MASAFRYSIRASRIVSVKLSRKESAPATVVIDLWASQGGALVELPATVAQLLMRKLDDALREIAP